ncbi:hypothetical protein DXG01_007726 [Tephrocybe rancida]|nr:hypothetical protein DXG01_007726 [Tephrocybe rancida]
MSPSLSIFYGAVINPKTLTCYEALPNCLLLVGPSGNIEWIEKHVELHAVHDVLAQKGCIDIDIVELQPGQFLLPGFIDTHIHPPQFPSMARPPLAVISDPFIWKLTNYLRISYMPMRAFIGKCNIDRSDVPSYVERSAEASIRDTKAIISHVRSLSPQGETHHTSHLVQPILTPRFALSCTPKLLNLLGELASSDPSLHIQTHIAENRSEVEEVHKCFPNSPHYAGVYDHFGLLRSNTILAHGVWLKDAEVKLIKERNAGISHCPTSNFNLTSGVAAIGAYLDHGVKVGLGTDVSGGYSPSILNCIQNASIASKVLAIQAEDLEPDPSPTTFANRPLSVDTLLYLATLGGAEVCDLDQRVGSFERGKSFDALLVDTRTSTGAPGLWFPEEYAAETDEDALRGLLERFLFGGDDRNISRVYVQGRFIGDLAFIVYWGIFLLGYDTGIAGGVVSQPPFQREFGLRNPDGTKNEERTNHVSSLVVSVLQAGAFFGALGSAPASSKFGRKPTLLVFTLVFSLGAILATAARDHEHHGLELIYAGRVVSGLGIGGISAVAPAFVSECAPKEVRGRVTGLFQVTVSPLLPFVIIPVEGIELFHYNVVGPNVWRIPFGVQLLPAGIVLFGLFTVKESPRYLTSIGRTAEAAQVLAYLRKVPVESEVVMHEMAEIQVQADEERTANLGAGFWMALKAQGGGVRFGIGSVIFLLQQWSGQNSVGYYGPQIFESIGFTGTKNSLLASGVYGIVKVLATIVFIFLLVESLGRRLPLIISSLGMGSLFIAIGAILKAYPPVSTTPLLAPDLPPPAAAATAMAMLLYLLGSPAGHLRLGDLPDAHETLWDGGSQCIAVVLDFIPETKGRSLEDMDIIFGAVTAEERAAHIAAREERVAPREREHGIPIVCDEIDGPESRSMSSLMPKV